VVESGSEARKCGALGTSGARAGEANAGEAKAREAGAN
jgi:hypothetical protein